MTISTARHLPAVFELTAALRPVRCKFAGQEVWVSPTSRQIVNTERCRGFEPESAVVLGKSEQQQEGFFNFLSSAHHFGHEGGPDALTLMSRGNRQWCDTDASSTSELPVRTKDMAYDDAILVGYQIQTGHTCFERPGIFDDVNFFLTVSTPVGEGLADKLEDVRPIRVDGGSDYPGSSHDFHRRSIPERPKSPRL